MLLKPAQQDHEFQCSDSVMSVFMTGIGLYSTSWFKFIILKRLAIKCQPKFFTKVK